MEDVTEKKTRPVLANVRRWLRRAGAVGYEAPRDLNIPFS